VSNRPRNTRIGDEAEYLTQFFLSRIAQAIPVPRQEDFGIDYHGALLIPTPTSLLHGPPFQTQVKSRLGLFEEQPFGRPYKAKAGKPAK